MKLRFIDHVPNTAQSGREIGRWRVLGDWIHSPHGVMTAMGEMVYSVKQNEEPLWMRILVEHRTGTLNYRFYEIVQEHTAPYTKVE